MRKSREKNVLLISMPFGALERPALGLSLLKEKLRDIGVPCDVEYLNVSLAEMTGCEEYQWVNYELPYTAFAGDWLFTEALYGPRPEIDCIYLNRVLRQTWRISDQDIARLYRIRALIPHFLDHCLDTVNWQEYAMVGFTSTFEQNIASLALARLLRERYPRLLIVFGGANWEAEMGEEFHRRFPFVDFVCSGESEQSFPSLVRKLLHVNAAPPAVPAVSLPDKYADIPGIIYRGSNGATVYTGPPDILRNMDSLPIPDYSDYFRMISSSSATNAIIPSVLLESSRGCWWGAKSHCTFCGLNGGSMSYRSKSPKRLLDELEYLTDHWKTESVEAVDNILDMKYFENVLPALARARRPYQIFYEVKANLGRRHLELLKAAGVTRIQPGIESMSDHVLKLMRKGTTALKNVQLLKWCREYGIVAEWNILYGFPGETREDYLGMLELLRAIRFLPPPTACGPVRLDRFSPYFNTPREFGLGNVRPLDSYQYLYPFGSDSLSRIAYYFDYDYLPHADPRGFAEEVIAFANEWKNRPETGLLSSIRLDDQSLRLIDTRSDAVRPTLSLSGLECAAYEYCDQVHSWMDVARYLKSLSGSRQIDESGVKAFLDSLVDNRLMVRDQERYLSLAIRQNPIGVSSIAANVNIFDSVDTKSDRALSSYLKEELRVL